MAVLWNVQGDCDNYMVLKGHRNAVLDLCWTTDGQHIISASPDKTVRAWDAITGKQVCFFIKDFFKANQVKIYLKFL
jgi:Prp8 binding protein